MQLIALARFLSLMREERQFNNGVNNLTINFVHILLHYCARMAQRTLQLLTLFRLAHFFEPLFLLLVTLTICLLFTMLRITVLLQIFYSQRYF